MTRTKQINNSSIGLANRGSNNERMNSSHLQADGISTSPSSISCCRSLGSLPSTVHPTLTQVPRISLTVPANSLAMDLFLMVLAISTTSSRPMLPLCLMFLTFFLSLSGSLSALMTSAAAEGTTETLAWRFWTVSLTVTRRPFQSLAVSLAMSSPIFFGERPSGPILGARDDAAPTSPPVTRTKTSTTCDGSSLGGMAAAAAGVWVGFGKW
uniref:Uncharacterized protein n=1 Tax=Zea mays TaxID=4577 RepID=C4J6H1_MAIZE|nr:unknown [Zea mays]